MSTTAPAPIQNNDALHQEAVKLLVAAKDAKNHTADYNKRRREATEALRPVLTEIWNAFERGETVGGFAGKEVWAKGQGVTIRHVQKVIAGPKPKTEANSVRARFPELGCWTEVGLEPVLYRKRPISVSGSLVLGTGVDDLQIEVKVSLGIPTGTSRNAQGLEPVYKQAADLLRKQCRKLRLWTDDAEEQLREDLNGPLIKTLRSRSSKGKRTAMKERGIFGPEARLPEGLAEQPADAGGVL